MTPRLLCTAFTLLVLGEGLSTEFSLPDEKPLPPGVVRRVGRQHQPTFKLFDESRDRAGAAVSQDLSHVATLAKETDVHIWKAATGKLVHTLRGHRILVCEIAFSPDGLQLATGDVDGFIRLWDAVTGRETTALRHKRSLWHMAYCLNGKRLITVGGDGFIRLWDTKTGLEEWALRFEADITGLAVAPDGREVALGYSEHVGIWDVTKGKEIAQIRDDIGSCDRANALKFSKDGKSLAIANATFSRVAVFRRTSEREWERESRGYAPATTLALVDSEKLIACGTGKGTIVILDRSSGKRLTELGGDSGPVQSVETSPDGRYLISGYANETVLFWDMEAIRLNILNQVNIDK